MADIPNSFFDADTVSTIIKWSVTILITGFIAQFGKKIANFMTEKVKSIRNRKNSVDNPDTGKVPVTTGASGLETANSKLGKKLAKAKAKELKKRK